MPPASRLGVADTRASANTAQKLSVSNDCDEQRYSVSHLRCPRQLPLLLGAVKLDIPSFQETEQEQAPIVLH